MLYITTKPIKNVNYYNRIYTIDRRDLNALINEPFPNLIPTDEDRDNEFINEYELPVSYYYNPEFKTGDKLIVASDNKLQMVIF